MLALLEKSVNLHDEDRNAPHIQNSGETIEGRVHGFPDTQRSVESTDLGQHMGRIGALPPTCFKPFLLKKREHGLKEKLLGIVLHQASKEFAEHRGVKSGIVEIKGSIDMPNCFFHA